VFLLRVSHLYSGNVIGLDIHQNQVSVRAMIVGSDGNVYPEFRERKGFRKDLRVMAEWGASPRPDCVAMESASVYWSSPYRVLYQRGVIPTCGQRLSH
jgi:hypothetical protein